MDSQLPSGALVTFFGERPPFKVNQPKRDGLFFPGKSTGHLRFVSCATMARVVKGGPFLK